MVFCVLLRENYWENLLQCCLIDRPVSLISLKTLALTRNRSSPLPTHELVLPSPCVDSGAQTWVIILQGKHLCPLSHLVTPSPLLKYWDLNSRPWASTLPWNSIPSSFCLRQNFTKLLSVALNSLCSQLDLVPLALVLLVPTVPLSSPLKLQILVCLP